MKKFNVTVNGTTYEVDVEEIGGAPSIQAVAPKAAPTPAAAPAPAPKPAAPAAPAAPSGADSVLAPMSGTIFKIPVKVGQAVKYGEPVIVLEAMKMENDIPAPVDGTVKEILVSEGNSVQPGDVLAIIG